MIIDLLRHGIAHDLGAGYEVDSERPLTAEGRKKMQKIARALRALEVDPDEIIASPFVRARQTAEIVAEEFSAHRKLRLSDNLTPDGNHRLLVEELGREYAAAEKLLLVGHEPHLSGFISFLISGSPHGAMVTVKKGGFARLALDRWDSGHAASLECLLAPKQLLKIG